MPSHIRALVVTPNTYRQCASYTSMIFIGLQVVLFLFNYAADLSLGWARREERKRGERHVVVQNEREREREERNAAREKERERERERARATDRWTDRQRGKPKRGKWGGGRVGVHCLVHAAWESCGDVVWASMRSW